MPVRFDNGGLFDNGQEGKWVPRSGRMATSKVNVENVGSPSSQGTSRSRTALTVRPDQSKKKGNKNSKPNPATTDMYQL